MFDLPTTSASCCTGASVGIIAMIAAVMSLLSFAVLSPHRVSANVKRGVMLSVLVLMAGLVANSARAEGPFGNNIDSGSYPTAEAACQKSEWYRQTVYNGFSNGLHRWNCMYVINPSYPDYWGVNHQALLNPAHCPAPNVINTELGLCTAPAPECGPRGTYNPATNTCICDEISYRASVSGSETCVACPSPGYILGESPSYASGQGEVPSQVCLEFEQSLGGQGCWREPRRSIRQGTSWAAELMRWTGESCTVGTDSPTIGEPDSSPDNPNSPDDCLAAGMGYIEAGGAIQCVQNGTAENPVQITTKSTTTNSDGSKTVTTTTTTNTTNSTHTSSTSVTYNNGNTQGEGDKTETSETTTGNSSQGGAGAGGGDGSCGGPGQPACRVTITGGTGEGQDVAGQLSDVTDTFNGDGEKSLLGDPMSAFLTTAQTKLSEAIFLPEISAGDCSPFEIWEGVSINFCPGVEIARDILSWLFYLGACFYGWTQLQRAIDRGAQ